LPISSRKQSFQAYKSRQQSIQLDRLLFTQESITKIDDAVYIDEKIS